MTKDKFLKQFDTIPAQFPIQGEARDVIHNGLDFPTTRDERWKYTRISSIIDAEYTRNEGGIKNIDAFKIGDKSWRYLVFVNGVYRSNLSDQMPTGISMQSISAVSEKEKQAMLENLGRLANFKKQAFESLNTAYFEDGAFLEVGKNAEIEAPICILNLSDGKAQVSNPRNLIHVALGAKVSFVHHFVGHLNEGGFTNSVVEIIADENSDAHFYLVQDEGIDSATVTATYVRQKKDSRFSMTTITKSGRLVRNNIHAAIAGEGCETNMFGLYFTDGSQHVDNQTYADHQQPNCNSNELYKGVMSDRSTGVFNGKIMVNRAAQKTNAFQSNQNILLSDKATINTKPELEIYADDVRCSHGCTVGQLDEEAMFYLQSRGLGKEAAHRLLVQAFATDVIEKIEIEALRENVEQFIEQKFQ
jgi:Fe-S cluster assembly protein SufD